jgi:hypothetical protein
LFHTNEYKISGQVLQKLAAGHYVSQQYRKQNQWDTVVTKYDTNNTENTYYNQLKATYVVLIQSSISCINVTAHTKATEFNHLFVNSLKYYNVFY